MRVIERQEIKLQLKDLEHQAMTLASRGWPVARLRSSGVHLSGILKYVALQTGLLQSGQVSAEDFEEDFPLRMALGMAVEMWLQAVWPSMIWQPGEVQLDGIVGSPDGFTAEFGIRNDIFGPVVRDVGLIEEFKLTWKSRRNRHSSIVGEWLWIRQIMSYAWMWSKHYGYPVKHARLHVVWVNGGYEKFQLGEPVYNTYLIEFTEQEMERNWQNVIVANRDKVQAEEH